MIGANTDALYARMRAMELEGRSHFTDTAPYLSVRRLLVDWIFEIGEEYKLANSTMHVAVGYFDRVLQGMDVHRSRYQLVAMACFLLAAKYEEAEERVPSAKALNDQASNVYPPKLVHQMEVLVLTRLNWCLTVVSPCHFLGYFLGRGALFTSDSMAYKPLVAKVPRYLKKYIDFFADLTLQGTPPRRCVTAHHTTIHHHHPPTHTPTTPCRVCVSKLRAVAAGGGHTGGGTQGAGDSAAVVARGGGAGAVQRS